MRVTNSSIEKLLKEAGIAFQNVNDRTDIKEKLVPYGYDDTRIQAMIENQKDTNVKYLDMLIKYATARECTLNLYEKTEEEKKRYLDLKIMALNSLPGDKNTGIRERLGINSQLVLDYKSFVIQCEQFYKHALNNQDILDTLTTFGTTEEKLQLGLTGIEDLKLLKRKQKEAQGEAQKATKQRDKSSKELDTRYKELKKVCKVALRDEPQLREVLGFLERSAPLKKKPAEVVPEDGTQPIVDSTPSETKKSTSRKNISQTPSISSEATLSVAPSIPG